MLVSQAKPGQLLTITHSGYPEGVFLVLRLQDDKAIIICNKNKYTKMRNNAVFGSDKLDFYMSNYEVVTEL